MKKLLLTLSLTGAFLTSIALADDKEHTVKGEAQCAKCSLKKAEKCTNVIVAKEDGKEVVYYLADNEATKGFHKKVCTDKLKVTAKGHVKEKDGKKELAAIKIEEEKK